jgi:DNA-binding MarR family transcriptional regulator
MSKTMLALFDKLRELRTFERGHLHFLKTIEDYDLVGEIAYRQASGQPITMNEALRLELGSIATVQRQLRRLRHAGVIAVERHDDDRRVTVITLTPKAMKALIAYAELLGVRPAMASRAARRSPKQGELVNHDSAYRHACTFYGDDAALHQTTAAFLGEGLRQGEACVLFAAPDVAGTILHVLGKPGRKMITRTYASTVDDQLAAIRDEIAGGRGARIRIVGDMRSALDGGLDLRELIAYEHALEREIPGSGVTILCQYDVRRFGGEDLLSALHCHADSARYPLIASHTS